MNKAADDSNRIFKNNKTKIKTETSPYPTINSGLNPVKELDRLHKRFCRQWEMLLSRKTYEKSLTVEENYPYFSLAVKPRIPFGLTKFKELLMRVGLHQNAKPMRVCHFMYHNFFYSEQYELSVSIELPYQV